MNAWKLAVFRLFHQLLLELQWGQAIERLETEIDMLGAAGWARLQWGQAIERLETEDPEMDIIARLLLQWGQAIERLETRRCQQ